MDSFVDGRAQASKRSLSGSLQPRSGPSRAEDPAALAPLEGSERPPQESPPKDPLGASERLTQGAGSSLPTPSLTEGAAQQVPLDPSIASGQSQPETASSSLPPGQGPQAPGGLSLDLPSSGPLSPSPEGAFTQALEAVVVPSGTAPSLPFDLRAELQSLDSSIDWTSVRGRGKKDKKPSRSRTSSLAPPGRLASRSRSPLQDDSSDDSRPLSERRLSASPPTKKGKTKPSSKKVLASQADHQGGGRQ